MDEKTKGLAGKQFGRWKVENEFIILNGQKKWKCVCQCGTVRFVFESNLISGKSKSCGCYSRERARKRVADLTGRVFGRLTVTGRAENKKNGRICWNCRCECGNDCTATGQELLSNKKRSCGCLRREPKNVVDLTGCRFGRLTVLNDSQKRSYKGSVIWHCKCDCGNEIDVHSDNLIFNRSVSCGCRRREWQKQIHSTLHCIDNTCIEFLEKRNHRSDNTSGYQGVQRINDNKYRSTIGFKGRRHHLGYYDTFEEAVNARKEAEDRMHKAFLEQYYN